MAKIRAVILDLDGTLLDHATGVRAGLQAVLTRFDVRENLEDVQTRHTQLMAEGENAVLSGTDLTVAQERVFRQLLEDLGVPDPGDNARRAAKTYFRAYEDSAQLLPGAVELLEELRSRGLRIGVLSNFLRAADQPRVERFGLADLVDVILFSEDVPAPKPDPRAFLTMCEALGVDPKYTLMVGDTIRVDVSGALDAGLRAIWFSPRRTDLAPAREIVTIARLEQILDHV